MNLYKLSQTVNQGYDTYDSCVVVAESEEVARTICPSEFYKFIEGDWAFVYHDGSWEREQPSTWAPIEQVKVEFIGQAAEAAGLTSGTVICASFNAG